jgi:hypothetical protein
MSTKTFEEAIEQAQLIFGGRTNVYTAIDIENTKYKLFIYKGPSGLIKTEQYDKTPIGKRMIYQNWNKWDEPEIVKVYKEEPQMPGERI